MLSSLLQSIGKQRGSLSPNLVASFDEAIRLVRLGVAFDQAFSKTIIFQDKSCSAEKDLIVRSYQQPELIKKNWIDWMKGDGPYFWQKSHAIQFINAFLENNGPLWVVGEETWAVEQVVQVLRLNFSKARITALGNETFESFSLNCKRRKQQPEKNQLVLWVESDSNGQIVIVGIDELIPPNSGTLDYIFCRIFLFKREWELCPSGHIPECWDSLKLAQKIDLSLFKST